MYAKWGINMIKGRIGAFINSRLPNHPLPQALYNEPEVLEFDFDAMFRSRWIFAGLEAEVPKNGDYFTVEIGKDSIIIVRGTDGEIRSFHNTCRHRGAQICEEKKGNSPRLVCPYHQWTYGLDGRLIYAGRMPENFDKTQYGLSSASIECIEGIIFINLSCNPEPLADMRGKLSPLLAPHKLAQAKVAHQVIVREMGNWKLVMENARECYHCDAKHPELMTCYRDVSTQRPNTSLDEVTREFHERLEAAHIPCGPVQGPFWQAIRSPLAEGSTSFTIDGRPAVALPLGVSFPGGTGALRFAIDPHHFCHVTEDYAVFFRALPVAPQETSVSITWLVNADAKEGVDYEVERLIEVWFTTNDQDRQLVENNQRGVNSSRYQPGPYSEEAEWTVSSYVDWYCDEALKFLSSQQSEATK